MLFDLWERYRRYILLAGAILFLGSSVWLYQSDQENVPAKLPLEAPAYAKAHQTAESDAESEELKKPAESSNQKNSEPPAAAPLYVDVKGVVKQPGMYRFEPGMRVADAIAKAGGTLPDADLDQINLAQPLSDGSAVIIPAKGSSAAPSSGQQTVALPPYGVSSGSMNSQSGGQERSINVNTATAEELTTLPGIGLVRAKAILSYRTEKGGFRSVEELKEIEGIGDKMFERIKDRVRIQ
ncbi:helix-hairpin-helix domain-containing protein [uncultured Brevibacillus sp.]|uniref:helix-hairpin-helix domain-containing protein n=1 Tax=uncultured Brevibacillus sp. TaxID=169970 RepID=UPI002591688D|nr:helix-hairpin-helix domain-containing protein [uncultured Brevibacillus sp.]